MAYRDKEAIIYGMTPSPGRPRKKTPNQWVELCLALDRRMLRQSDLADLCKVTQSAVSDWVTGRAVPREDYWPVLQNLGVDISDMEGRRRLVSSGGKAKNKKTSH